MRKTDSEKSTADRIHFFNHLRFGCDPELFLFDKTTKKLVSGHPYIKGTKDRPHPVNKGAVQLDGISAEFNIEPAKTSSEFFDNVIAVLRELRAMVPDNLDLVPLPAVNIGTGEEAKVFYDSLPDQVKELGCSPSFNIETLETTFPPGRPQQNPYMFTGSGHIHVGFTDRPKDEDLLANRSHLADCYYVWRSAYFSMHHLQEPLYNLEILRRSLYGKRGEVRVKTYGVELREPSNSWLWSTYEYTPATSFAGYSFQRSSVQQQTAIRTLLGDPMVYVKK